MRASHRNGGHPVEVILILIPLSAIVVVGAIALFFWAVDAGQFEDIDRQGRA
jgi:cbb3-type cytochrome oxidase maturation protein